MKHTKKRPAKNIKNKYLQINSKLFQADQLIK